MRSSMLLGLCLAALLGLGAAFAPVPRAGALSARKAASPLRAAPVDLISSVPATPMEMQTTLAVAAQWYENDILKGVVSFFTKGPGLLIIPVVGGIGIAGFIAGFVYFGSKPAEDKDTM